MNRRIIGYILAIALLTCPEITEAGIWKKKKRRIPQKVELSAYEKLFQGKKRESATGEFVTVHKLDGKVYIEYPLRLLERQLLLASTTTASTDPSVCINGYKENTPLHIRFTLKDGQLQLRRVQTLMTTDSQKAEVRQAIKQNFGDPVSQSYKVLAYTSDSLAIVVDMTELFLNGEPLLSPIPRKTEAMKVTAVYAAGLSSVREVKAFEDNMSVKSQLSYTCTIAREGAAPVKDQPLTVEVTRTLLLLPERKMKPRLSDLRIGTFLTSKRYLSEEGKPIGKYSYAHRWQLELGDKEAWQRGEPTQPSKPIVFYLDPLFPTAWREPIRQGVLRWNKAFEKIGFKDVIQLRDFPTDDPSFDPDNLKYSCIRYVPTAVANAMGPSWVDPETGEILNASVFIFHDVLRMIRYWRFVQTAQLDGSIRGKELPEEILNESLSYVVAHEVGHCLGLMHNMAASSAYPVDSLRSVSFTQQYGTTPSIMDYARFNYIAQPEDKGVRLTPPDLGPYDEFAIRWLYSYFKEDLTLWEEARLLEAWVDEKAEDPMYRYGRQQLQSRYDPSALEEDLGNDPIKASEYGIRNLKYILPRMNAWITDDPTAEERKNLYNQIVNQYYRYLRNVAYNIGGIYLSDAKEEAPQARYTPIPREVQKASTKWVLRQIKQSTWLDDTTLLPKFPLGMAPSVTLAERIVKVLTSLHEQVTLSASLADNPYTVEEYFDDLYREIWESALTNRPLTLIDRILQTQLLTPLSEQMKAIGGQRVGIAPTDTYCYGFHPSHQTDQSIEPLSKTEEVKTDRQFGSGYGWQAAIDVRTIEETPAYYLEMLLKIERLLESGMNGFATEDQPHYQAMLFALKQIIGK